jgi:predicted RNA-binding protein with PUA-like domain
MKLNDKVLFYHSQQDRSVMGAMEVVCTAHQDPTTTDPQWVSVTFEPTHSLRFPLTLAEIKADPLLQDIGLIRQPRLSVVKIRKSEYDRIVLLGEGF